MTPAHLFSRRCRPFCTALLCALALSAAAGEPSSALSASAKLRLARTNSRPAARLAPAMGHEEMADVWLTLADTAVCPLLRNMGASVSPPLANGLRTARLPLHRLADAARLPGVAHLALSRRVTLCNDSARLLSGMEGVGTATTLSEDATDHSLLRFTGRGVVVGMVDTGVDFGHINLLDSAGRRRVVAAYLPADTTGTPPVVDGVPLPGSHYDTPEAIDALTTDNPAGSHGTHTTGTAAGSYRDNGYYGVAPEASLVIAAMPDSALTDVNIASAVRYIFDYADRAGMPAVVNMSLASHEGAHDGTSELCRVFDELSGPGRICVLSAGNDGLRRMHLAHTFAGTADTVRTCLASYTSTNGTVRGYLSLWNRSSAAHMVRLTVVDRNAGGMTVWQSADVAPLPDDSVATFSAETDTVLARYMTGTLLLANAVENNGLYHTLMELDMRSTDTRYCLALVLTAPDGTRFDAWADGSLLFAAHSLRGFTDGSKAGSISDLATGDRTITVGAYCSRSTIPLADGGTQVVPRSVPGTIGYFSSYGPDARGLARPDICAPGMSLVSSTNRYDMDLRTLSWLGEVDGVEYGYRSIYGTSMSAPMVTGAVALLLQADGTLTPERARQALADGAVRDDNVNTSTGQWGAGKLHVGNALREVLSSGIYTVVAEPDATRHASVAYSDGSLTVTSADGVAQVAVADMQGRTLARHSALAGATSVHLPLTLPAGVFIATVMGRDGARLPAVKFVVR